MSRNKKWTAMMMASAMMLSSMGLGQIASAEESKEVVTLQMLSLPSNTSGLQENSWWADLLAEKVGVQIELLPAGDQGAQKLQAMMASGSLPDLVVFKEPKQVSNAVAGDMLLSFEDYKELVPDVYKNAGAALQYSADMLSEGQNKPYSVGIQISTNAPTVGNINSGPRLRYDLYKEAGSPEINTLEDYLGVLKTMQELSPVNEDGKQVYGLSIWSDWDQSTAFVPVCFMSLIGCDDPSEASLVYKDLTDNSIHTFTEEDNKYFRMLKFFFDANQMGLLDPDSMTQRFDDAQQKFTDGRVLMGPWTWGYGSYDNQENHAAGKGFMTVAAKDAVTSLSQQAPIGNGWSIAVSSSTKYPELCMEYINYLYSDEGLMELMNGPKGLIWDVNEEGIPEVTEEGYQYLIDGAKELPGGGALGAGINTVNVLPFQNYTICKTYGVPFGSSLWPTYEEQEDALRDTWREDMGVKDDIQYLTEKTENGILVSPFAPTSAVPDDMRQIEANAGSVIQQMSWKMIYAEDEAEFEALKAEMISQAEAAGIDTYAEWYKAEFEKALTEGGKYVAE